jgi:hypothetical protein
MALTFPPQLRKAILKRRERPHQQFTSPNRTSTWGGATGCTHDVLKYLIYLWTGKKVSPDDISRVALYPWPAGNPGKRGLRPVEVQRVINHWKLPYEIRFGLTAAQVLSAAKKGPVGFGHVYGWWPEWKGYRYGGTYADGRPNGYATPSGKAGRTQLAGFNYGAHFGVVLGTAIDDRNPDLVYAWEPNHGSPSRPEKPAYDRMTRAQFTVVYDSYRKVLGRTAYAVVPTKTLPAEGY